MELEYTTQQPDLSCILTGLEEISTECTGMVFTFQFCSVSGKNNDSANMSSQQLLGDIADNVPLLKEKSVKRLLKRLWFGITDAPDSISGTFKTAFEVLKKLKSSDIDNDIRIPPWDLSCKDPLLNLLIGYYKSWSKGLPLFRSTDRNQFVASFLYPLCYPNYLQMLALSEIELWPKRLVSSTIVGIDAVYLGLKDYISFGDLHIEKSLWREFCAELFLKNSSLNRKIKWNAHVRFSRNPHERAIFSFSYHIGSDNTRIHHNKVGSPLDESLLRPFYFLFAAVRSDATLFSSLSIADGPSLALSQVAKYVADIP